jgi:hypothetical protein
MISVIFPMFSRSTSSIAAEPRSSEVRHVTEVQDGHWQTGSSCNFGLEQDINAIPTATHVFSMLPEQMPSRTAHCDVDRCQKTKMAVGKPEVVITLVWNKISMRFQRLHPYFRCCPNECRIERLTATSTDVRKLRWQLAFNSSES